MVIIAVAALILGILTGTFWQNGFTAVLTSGSDYILYLLMFLVGISIGLHRGLLDRLRQYHIRILVIPAGIIAGSVLGGALCGLLLGIPLYQSTSIASGLGWYSLTGITITNLMGPRPGSIAFLSNLMREIFSFFSIPWISRHLGYFSCIAPAGATSEDTTLPMMIRYTNEETVVISVVNGVICSAAVPVLIAFCSQAFR
ncbi:MAG TPA: lysine exporter LysO family protein [Candidatus Lachnoclostridium stercorigallinarum]|uniref:Lysine exporter LysO family protein n=1 Tax=Candidatus Lachnoclostridium stercorigallinarum TaxID=2838634 RepID=A0A9D2GEL6_9FIRM|nr:lysine exporter LysO family protein [Candidatus Lachnoclostridium stercorigallinarum]